MKIAVLDDYFNIARELADWGSLGEQAQLTVFQAHHADLPARAAALEPFDVVVAMRERTPFPAALIEKLPNLRLLVTTGMRNNSIDMQACRERGITVCGAPGCPEGAGATTELAWALILALSKRLPHEQSAMRAGLWQTGMPVLLAGKRLGLVGLGNLGQRAAAVGQALGMEAQAWSPNLTDERAAQAGVRKVGKDELFSTSDVISVHLVLSERTAGVVDAAAIAAMKPQALFVNTSRAGLVDHAALVRALKEGRIAGAGLDVFPTEPLPADDEVRSLPNVVLTPHLGYVSHENFRDFYRNAVQAIAAWAAGKPVRVLNES